VISLYTVKKMVVGECFFSPRPYLMQTWIFFYFNTPALIVGKVKVQIVHFVIRHQVYILLNSSDGHKISTYVQKKTAISECRTICNMNGRDTYPKPFCPQRDSATV